MKKHKRPVFLIVQHLRPGGIEVMSLNILESLRHERDVHIVALEGEREKALSDWPVLSQYQGHIHFLNKKPGLSPIKIMALMKLFLHHRPEAVHTHHIGPMIYGGIAARLCGVRNLIHTEHDGWHLEKNGRLQGFVMRVLSPHIVAVANHVANCVSRDCKTDTPCVVYNGIDTNIFCAGNKNLARINQNLPQDVYIIGCAGRMEEVKGHRHLIEALLRLPENVHVAFAGDGTLRNEMIAYALKLGLKSRVHFLGRIDYMCEFYQCLDVFCLPSLKEGFPLSPLEAQSCGIKTVVSDVGGCSEALCPKTGLLAQAGNTQNLAYQLKGAITASYRGEPRQFILSHFDLNDMAKKYAEFYRGTRKSPEILYEGVIRHV